MSSPLQGWCFSDPGQHFLFSWKASQPCPLPATSRGGQGEQWKLGGVGVSGYSDPFLLSGCSRHFLAFIVSPGDEFVTQAATEPMEKQCGSPNPGGFSPHSDHSLLSGTVTTFLPTLGDPDVGRWGWERGFPSPSSALLVQQILAEGGWPSSAGGSPPCSSSSHPCSDLSCP